jgi:5-formyltetrahydrofolate cyclo-ligase
MEKQTKTQLRKKFLAFRDKLTPVARARDSAIIRQRIFRHPAWQDAQTILIYVSFRSEVETLKLIQEALDRKKRIVVPIVDAERKEVSLSELRAVGDLAAGTIPGIYEPAIALRKAVVPFEVELVLVPGAAFDRKGGRIGMGGGYFDKLLANMPQAKRIGLAFSCQVRKQPFPLEKHDVPMHLVITEKEVIHS